MEKGRLEDALPFGTYVVLECEDESMVGALLRTRCGQPPVRLRGLRDARDQIVKVREILFPVELWSSTRVGPVSL